MSKSTPDPTQECFTDFAIQEYLMGRLDATVRVDLEKHFNTCKECATCHNQYELERNFITTLLSTPSTTPPGLCLTDEILSQFLDSSLNDTEHTKCESHLAGCNSCQQELLSMYNELTQLSNPSESDQSLPSSTPEGIILRMPKRKPGSQPRIQINWPIDEIGSA